MLASRLTKVRENCCLKMPITPVLPAFSQYYCNPIVLASFILAVRTREYNSSPCRSFYDEAVSKCPCRQPSARLFQIPSSVEAACEYPIRRPADDGREVRKSRKDFCLKKKVERGSGVGGRRSRPDLQSMAVSLHKSVECFADTSATLNYLRRTPASPVYCGFGIIGAAG